MENNINYKKLGNIIKKHRIERNLSQAQVCELIGISDSHYSNLELGKAKCSIEILIKLCNFYHLPIMSCITNNYYPATIPYSIEESISNIPDIDSIQLLSYAQKIIEDIEKQNEKTNR